MLRYVNRAALHLAGASFFLASAATSQSIISQKQQAGTAPTGTAPATALPPGAKEAQRIWTTWIRLAGRAFDCTNAEFRCMNLYWSDDPHRLMTRMLVFKQGYVSQNPVFTYRWDPQKFKILIDGYPDTPFPAVDETKIKEMTDAQRHAFLRDHALAEGLSAEAARLQNEQFERDMAASEAEWAEWEANLPWKTNGSTAMDGLNEAVRQAEADTRRSRAQLDETIAQAGRGKSSGQPPLTGSGPSKPAGASTGLTAPTKEWQYRSICVGYLAGRDGGGVEAYYFSRPFMNSSSRNRAIIESEWPAALARLAPGARPDTCINGDLANVAQDKAAKARGYPKARFIDLPWAPTR